MGRLSKRINGAPPVSLSIGHTNETIKIKPGKKTLRKGDNDVFNRNFASAQKATTPRSSATYEKSRNTGLGKSKTINLDKDHT